MRRLMLTAVLILMGCASSTADRPATIDRPQIELTLPQRVFFGSGDSTGVSVIVDVTNRAKVPLTVKETELTASGMAQYTLEEGRQTFSEEIRPGESKRLTAFAMARASIDTPSEPLRVQLIVTFEGGGATFREIETR